MESYREEAARRAEVIHRVDSAFGILLVVATLWMNLVIVYVAQSEGVLWTAFGALLYTVAVVSGLFGILSQSWYAKYLGWLFCFASLMTSTFLVFNFAVGDIVPKHSLARVIIGFSEIVISFLLVDRIVIKAYLDRIRQVSWTGMHAPEDDALVSLARHLRRGISVILIFLLMLSVVLNLTG